MPFLRIASIILLVSFVLTHLLIKKDHLTTVWSEYALDPRFGWIMDIGLIVFGLACILTGLFPHVFTLTFVTNASANASVSAGSITKLKYFYLLVISGIANLGGTLIKTTRDKVKYLQRNVHLFFAVIELTFMPLFIVLNKLYIPLLLFNLASIHLVIFGIIGVLFIFEKLGINLQQWTSARLIQLLFSIGFLEKVIILMLIAEGAML